MTKHSGGNASAAAKTLAKSSSSKADKSNAGTTLANHKADKH